MKKLILTLSSFIFLFLGCKLVNANVIINEVKISPTEDRFIKLYNQDNTEVDLTNWYIQRKTQTGTSFNSLVTKTYFENKKISANGYFLISRTQIENSDIVIDGLTLTESNVIQLKNSNGEVVDKVCWGEVDSCSNLNPASGESILMADHTSSSVPAIETSSSDSDITASNDDSPAMQSKPKVYENPTMKVKILANALAFTGQPLEIKTNVFGFSNENVVLGRASWNFGDGGSFDQINNFVKFSHIYYYPGEYVLFLEYYQNSFSKTPEAISKMIIKVLPTTVTISKVGDVKDFFIELSNNASSDIDISSWVINANGKIFILPKNSVIMSKKQMTISGRITGFNYGDQNNLKLYSGTGELIYDYNIGIQPPKSPLSRGLSTGISSSDKGRLGGVISPAFEPLGAEVLQSNVINSESTSTSSMPIIPIASFIFIGASASAVYFIRRKKVIRESGDDFEILDE
ncbi:MAG: lamin tail domain-containing protein [Candidatus Paceibacterota bacterium]|jgi:hypothetical protein